MFNYEIENNEYDNLEECVNEVYELASKYAIDGVKNNIGGPFGAGIIYEKENGKYIILLIERNTVIASKDPTAHAEVNAIRSACKALNTRSLENCILVTTAKSCLCAYRLLAGQILKQYIIHKATIVLLVVALEMKEFKNI